MTPGVFIALAIVATVYCVVMTAIAFYNLVQVWSAPTDAARGRAALYASLALVSMRWRLGDNVWLNIVPAAAFAMALLAVVFFARAALSGGRGAT